MVCEDADDPSVPPSVRRVTAGVTCWKRAWVRGSASLPPEGEGMTRVEVHARRTDAQRIRGGARSLNSRAMPRRGQGVARPRREWALTVGALFASLQIDPRAGAVNRHSIVSCAGAWSMSTPDQALLVNLAVFGHQRVVFAKLLQDVVHVGDVERRMQRLLPLAVGVERFAEGADAGASLVFC